MRLKEWRHGVNLLWTYGIQGEQWWGGFFPVQLVNFITEQKRRWGCVYEVYDSMTGQFDQNELKLVLS